MSAKLDNCLNTVSKWDWLALGVILLTAVLIIAVKVLLGISMINGKKETVANGELGYKFDCRMATYPMAVDVSLAAIEQCRKLKK